MYRGYDSEVTGNGNNSDHTHELQLVLPNCYEGMLVPGCCV